MPTLNVDGAPPQGGLTSQDAAERFRRFGPNEPVSRRRLTGFRQFAALFANPLVAILLVASGISLALHETTDAALIAIIVVAGVVMNFWQTYRSERAAERLRVSVASTATVERDGKWKELPIREIVPGDLIRLSAGDLVPADAKLLASRDLSVQESALTGESLPVDKHAARGEAGDELVFLGTSVISGTATAVTVATGPRTRFGDIARRVNAAAPESEFDRGLRRFSLLILRTTVVLVLFILFVALSLGRNPIESLLFAVALGVGLTPEFLPMIASVTLTAGALRMAEDGVIVKHLPAIQNFGSIDILCSDKTGTLTSGEMQMARAVDATGADSTFAGRLAAVASRFETGVRNPLSAAILRAVPADAGDGYVKVDELPFDFERRRMSIVVDSAGGERLLIAKGAPEAVLAVSTLNKTPSGDAPLDDAVRARAVELYERMGEEGLRVLAVAYRTVTRRESYEREDEHDLVLAGFLAFADPVLADAAAALTDLAGDGVAVKILTGDNDRVACHVCGQVGLPCEQIMTGEDVDRLDDMGLAAAAERVPVFARVSPAQKNRILLALKRRGHVVGYIGDGINDAPSLRTADVGISVMNAADVARESADVILGRSGLRVLHRGILEGRRASGNLMKYLLMGTSSNFGNMFSMAAASVFLPFLPMLPTQILLNNLLYDLAQVTIPSDRVDGEWVQRPQKWDLRVIRRFMLFAGPLSSLFDFLTFFVLLRVLHADERLFHTGWFVESLATQTLVLFVVRTRGNPLVNRPSAALAATVVGAVTAGLILPVTPLAGVLGFTVPPWPYLVFLVVATAAYLALVESLKRWLLKTAI